MNNSEILMNIIENLKIDHIEEACDDCCLLPDVAAGKIIAALNNHGPKAAITAADRLMGSI